jgi:hypothetical protein
MDAAVEAAMCGHLLGLAVEQRIEAEQGADGAACSDHRDGAGWIDGELRGRGSKRSQQIGNEQAGPADDPLDLAAREQQHQHVDAEMQPVSVQQRRRPGREHRRHCTRRATGYHPPDEPAEHRPVIDAVPHRDCRHRYGDNGDNAVRSSGVSNRAQMNSIWRP